MRSFVAFAAIVLGAVSSCALAEPPVSLIYKWEPGDSALTRLTIDNTTTMDDMPARDAELDKKRKKEKKAPSPRRDERNPVTDPAPEDFMPEYPKGYRPIEPGTRSQKHVYTFKTEVASVEADGSANITMTVQSASIDADDSEGGRFVFDTANPGRSPSKDTTGAQRLRDLVGDVITMQVAPDGTVKRVEGLDQLADAMTIPLDANPLAEKLVRGLRSSADKEGMQAAVGLGMRFLPGKPVRVGDKWSSTVDQPLPLIGSARSEWESRLERFTRKGRDKIAIIKSKANVTVDRAGAAKSETLLAGVGLKFQDGTGTAQTEFDVERGRAIKSTMDLTLPIEMSFVDATSGRSCGMLQTVTSRMTHEIIDKP